jgi:hypothetical protein
MSVLLTFDDGALFLVGKIKSLIGLGGKKKGSSSSKMSKKRQLTV